MKFIEFGQAVKGIAFGSTTVGMGFRLRIGQDAIGTRIGVCGIGYNDGRHISLWRAYDGSLLVYNGTLGSYLGATPPDGIRVGDVYYVEVKATVHATLGEVWVNINGVEVLHLTGVNTYNASAPSTTPTSIWLGYELGNGNSIFYVDDLYVFDSAAGAITDFTGPVRVEALFTDAAGTYNTDFSLVGAGSQHQAVRDLAGPDNDTSYIQSATVGHQYAGNLQNTSLPAGTIYGVQACITARLTDAGFRGIKPLMVIGGSNYLGTEQNPGNSYRVLHEVFEENPDTSSAWTISDVNDLELGVEVSS